MRGKRVFSICGHESFRYLYEGEKESCSVSSDFLGLNVRCKTIKFLEEYSEFRMNRDF